MARTMKAEADALLAAVHRRDRAAQAVFFDLYKHAVADQILRMTGEPGWVDDLVQEVFIAAFAAIDTFRGDAAVKTWLHRITTNKVRNAWDSRRRRRARESRAVPASEAVVSGPEEELEAQEKLGSFYAALDDLPSTLREAFVCRIVEQMSLQDTSEVLGVPVSTVSYRARRAEARLCETLGIRGWSDV